MFRLRREVGKAGEEEEGGSPNLQLEDQVVPLRPMKSGVVIYLPTSRSQLLIRIRSFIWIRTEPDMQHGLQYSFFFFFFCLSQGEVSLSTPIFTVPILHSDPAFSQSFSTVRDAGFKTGTTASVVWTLERYQ